MLGVPGTPDPLIPVAREGSGPFVESWFIKANSPQKREAVWIKYTFFIPPDGRRGKASVWMVHFDSEGGTRRAIKETWPLGAVSWDHESLSMTFGDCRLQEGYTRGCLKDDRGEASWEMEFSDGTPALAIIPEALLRTPIPRHKQMSPMPNARFEGSLTIDGEVSEMHGWMGMLGHNWGPGHNHRYAWAHCNTFTDEADTVLEAGCSSLVIAGIETPLLTSLILRHHGRHYEMQRFYSLKDRKSDLSHNRWFFSVNEPPVRVEAVVQSATEEMVGLYYDNPDGTVTYCLNSKLAHMRLFLYEEGCRDVVLESSTAALEIGTPDPHHGTTMVL